MPLHPGASGCEWQLLESASNRVVRVSKLELGAESALQLLSLCQMAGLPVAGIPLRVERLGNDH
jgi:hypothetical protein